jgi:hypothetical protein
VHKLTMLRAANAGTRNSRRLTRRIAGPRFRLHTQVQTAPRNGFSTRTPSYNCPWLRSSE